MGHEHQDRVSLESARCIAMELLRRPDWIRLARENLDRWSRRNADAPGLLRCCGEWRAILDRLVEEVCGILTERSDEGQRLRKNRPLAGVVSPEDVWEIKRRVRGEQDAA